MSLSTWPELCQLLSIYLEGLGDSTSSETAEDIIATMSWSLSLHEATQPAFTCSKLIEIVEQGVKYVQS